MPRKRLRTLAAVLIVALALPVFFVAAPWVAASISPQMPREYEYSRAQLRVSDAQIQSILRSLALTMSPDEMSRLRDRLKDTAQLPFNKEDPLVRYVRSLSDFSDLMVQMDTLINDARAALSLGDIPRAEADLKQLKDLRDQAGALLRSLPGILGEGGTYYKIDTTVQLQKLEELSDLFQSYAEQIDQLAFEVKEQEGRILTKLSLNSSRPEVFVEEPFLVYGLLRLENETYLAGKSVTISWGTGAAVTAVTDATGAFSVSMSFPVGFRAGSVFIEARFDPQGPDSFVYIPSMAELAVNVMYYPTMILAAISPVNAKPLDSVEIQGNLTTHEGAPLGYRVIQLDVDGTSIGSTTTDFFGQFIFTFSVPDTLENGTHHMSVAFTAEGDRYASSNLTLPFTVGSLTTQLEVAADRTSLFSGTELTLDGMVSITNGSLWKFGYVSVFLDDAFYANIAVSENGSFLSILKVPIGVPIGAHIVRMEYHPNESWVQSSQATIELFIYNTPLIVLAAGGILTASSLTTYTVMRKRRLSPLKREQTQHPVPVEKPLPREEYSVDRLASVVQAESSDAEKVRRSYRLAQTLIGNGLDVAVRDSETHWEYFSRVVDKEPSLKDSFKRLSELFELAEYSPYPTGDAQAKEATEILLKLREKIEAVR